MRRTALVFPPHWYYASVPADLLVTGSQLAAAGVPVTCHDLSAGLSSWLLGKNDGHRALRRPETYLDDAAYARADDELRASCELIGLTHGARYDLYRLEVHGVDPGHVPSALDAGLSRARNPALRYLQEGAVPAILGDDPELVAVALVHPGQLLQVPVLGRLLRRAGYRGLLVVYGAHEDVLAPEDMAEDLAGEPPHVLYDDFDAVVAGEAERPLRLLAEGRPLREIPGLLAPGLDAARAGADDALAPLDFGLVDPGIYPYPAPIVDLRLSRSCPWGRCTFCAIPLHQAGYRSRPVDAAVAEMAAARAALGTRFFRFRDDLLTPAQLGELAAALPALDFRPRWTARARFENGFSREILHAAAAAGLEELWLGLESASARVRNLMVKGVAQPVVERILEDAAAAGIRVRALCMLGYPGETAEEARATLAFLERHAPLISTVALSPFQLMRAAPMGRDPANFGLDVVPDPLPRHERLRFTLPMAGKPDELLREAEARLRPLFHQAGAGPTLSHAWMRASLQARGWDS